jgi:hypothetical protein
MSDSENILIEFGKLLENEFTLVKNVYTTLVGFSYLEMIKKDVVSKTPLKISASFSRMQKEDGKLVRCFHIDYDNRVILATTEKQQIEDYIKHYKMHRKWKNDNSHGNAQEESIKKKLFSTRTTIRKIE